MHTKLSAAQLKSLQARFGEAIEFNKALAKYSSARIGGNADALLTVRSTESLAAAVRFCWQEAIPFQLLGGGSNVLISDMGVRELLILNKAQGVRFLEEDTEDYPAVWADSGSSLGAVARQAAQRGFAGLEWAAGIPGSLGGAVYGNAGAHGGEISKQLKLAKVLQPEKDIQQWSAANFGFGYRSSSLKNALTPAVVLSAYLNLEPGKRENIEAKMKEFKIFRQRTQPPGASMGSMFKNPVNDFAGRLIEAAGLKGTKKGQAKISELHANFFVNEGQASAQEVYALIQLAQKTVLEKFNVALELEIQLLGDWAASYE